MGVAVATLVILGWLLELPIYRNDSGTQPARALIYSAKWFEIFLLFFTLPLYIISSSINPIEERSFQYLYSTLPL